MQAGPSAVVQKIRTLEEYLPESKPYEPLIRELPDDLWARDPICIVKCRHDPLIFAAGEAAIELIVDMRRRRIGWCCGPGGGQKPCDEVGVLPQSGSLLYIEILRTKPLEIFDFKERQHHWRAVNSDTAYSLALPRDSTY
jgi:hypothetical protein